MPNATLLQIFLQDTSFSALTLWYFTYMLTKVPIAVHSVLFNQIRNQLT